MNQVIPPLPNKDEEHLKILSILHYVLAAMLALSVLGLVVHFLFMNTLMTTEGIWEDNGTPPPPEFLAIMRGGYAVAGFFLIVEVVLNVLSARDLRVNHSRTLSLITSGINCLNVPLGTALGVFTIIVLMRPSVIARYQSQSPH